MNITTIPNSGTRPTSPIRYAEGTVGGVTDIGSLRARRASREPIWSPEPMAVPQPIVPPSPFEVLAPHPDMLAILSRPQAGYDSADIHFRRIEHDLGAYFATLSLSAARSLLARLRRGTATADDTLVARFHRLVGDRRERLLAFLADAPRRAALAASLR